MIDWSLCSVVEMVPERLSGVPVLKNTRLPVDAVFNNYDSGMEPEEIAAIFQVEVADVRTVLAFREEQFGKLA